MMSSVRWIPIVQSVPIVVPSAMKSCVAVGMDGRLHNDYGWKLTRVMSEFVATVEKGVKVYNRCDGIGTTNLFTYAVLRDILFSSLKRSI